MPYRFRQAWAGAAFPLAKPLSFPPPWMENNDISPTTSLDPEREDLPSYSCSIPPRRSPRHFLPSHSDGASLPLVPEDYFGQAQEDQVSSNWAIFDYCEWEDPTLSKLNGPTPLSPLTSPTFCTEKDPFVPPAQEFPALPSFLKGSDTQNKLTSYDEEVQSYHFASAMQQIPSPEANSLPLRKDSDMSTSFSNQARENEEPKPKPKRGRPRLPRNEPSKTASFENWIGEVVPSHRVPHNQVEQKYRNGLNAELDRLRDAIPSTASQTGQAKLSKGMVLASAIDYIKHVEDERDKLVDENHVLRGRNKKRRRKEKAAQRCVDER